MPASSASNQVLASVHAHSPELPFTDPLPSVGTSSAKSFAKHVAAFREFGQPTRELITQYSAPDGSPGAIRTFVNEFWTARQRQAHSLHEVSYRACFKPQLPRFFIERLSRPGEIVYDPFMGRGTTILEAALLGRTPFGNDINPLSTIMARPRLNPPTLDAVQQRLDKIDFSVSADAPSELLAFYHPQTLHAIAALRSYLQQRREAGTLDAVDEWIRMVALNRLTGHSSGFFSVYTLPPNQAVSVKSQQRINERRQQTPPQRDVRSIILRKSRQLLSDCSATVRQHLTAVASNSLLLTNPAAATAQIPAGSVSLVVTSPPFLNVVQYAEDNWLRCWFAGIEVSSVNLTLPRKLDRWQEAMTAVFHELQRIVKVGGHVAFEVGEVHGGKTKLEQTVLPCGIAAGLEPVLVLINDQQFTKTANCWGVNNMAKGTNTNRIVLFRKA